MEPDTTAPDASQPEGPAATPVDAAAAPAATIADAPAAASAVAEAEPVAVAEPGAVETTALERLPQGTVIVKGKGGSYRVTLPDQPAAVGHGATIEGVLSTAGIRV